MMKVQLCVDGGQEAGQYGGLGEAVVRLPGGEFLQSDLI
jgi:hypothetical protein